MVLVGKYKSGNYVTTSKHLVQLLSSGTSKLRKLFHEDFNASYVSIPIYHKADKYACRL